MHRVAAIGIVLRHSGQSRVVTSATFLNRAVTLAIGATIKKYTTAAMIRNESRALMNEPYRNVLWFTVNFSAEKFGLPAIAAISGVIRSATSAATTAVNAVPMTTAIASSRRLPRVMNSLKPFKYLTPCVIELGCD